MKKKSVKKAGMRVIIFFTKFRTLPPGILDLLRYLSRKPRNLMQFNFYIMSKCPDLAEALILLERSGIDSTYVPAPTGQGHYPGSKNPARSGGGNPGTRDREYQ